MIIETSREYFSISSFLHRALKHFVAIWATLPRQLWRPKVWKSIATFTPLMPDEDKTFSGSFVLDLRIWWRQAHTLYNLFNTPNHEKKEHKQQQMWGKGVRNEVLDPTSHYR